MAECMIKNRSGSSVPIQDGCPQALRWFVMRVTYSRELRAQALFRSYGVECYVPMRREYTDSGVLVVPAIHNLLFVRSNREFLNNWKQKNEGLCPVRYAIDKSTGRPMMVCDKQMENFIRVTEASDVLYLDNPDVMIEKGTNVEVCAGPYKGLVGRLIRIRRDRKVVVGIPRLMAAAVSGIPLGWLRIV